MPRSPSRDLADRYAGNRGYFHQPDGIRRAKMWFSLAMLGLVLGWAAVDGGASPGEDLGPIAHTHGPLAHPHAAWDSACEACHEKHSAYELMSNPFSALDARSRWLDLTCEKCHSGSMHHQLVYIEGQAFGAACSNCHHDHGGRDQSLTRIADTHCTRCHEKLEAHRIVVPPVYAEKVTNFATDHPEFRELRDYANRPYDKRVVKFSHALHMTAGISYVPGGREQLTRKRLQSLGLEEAATRYATGQTDDSLVQLKCASCHRLDGGAGDDDLDPLRKSLAREPASAILPARGAMRAYYLPVNYDADCRSCHPLGAPDKVAGTKIAPGFPIPHRLQPAELEKLLQAGYARALIEKNPQLQLPADPGGRLDRPEDPAILFLRQEADRLARGGKKAILEGDPDLVGKPGEYRIAAEKLGYACAKCHDLDRIGRSSPKTVWFPHARFAHTAHRGVSCISCHPGTEAAFAPGGKVTEREPILIAGVDSCRACHSPKGTPVTLADGSRTLGGGVRHQCTDCHSYHNGDKPLQGRGAPARDPRDPLALPQFIRGKP